MTIIDDKVKEIASKHYEIIENECKEVCKRFNCNPCDLIIEFHVNTEIKIKINASNFSIVNKFTYNDGLITHEINSTS